MNLKLSSPAGITICTLAVVQGQGASRWMDHQARPLPRPSILVSPGYRSIWIHINLPVQHRGRVAVLTTYNAELFFAQTTETKWFFSIWNHHKYPGYRPWAESRNPSPPPLPGYFCRPYFVKSYYVPSYFQVVCWFSMHGQHHQGSLKYGTLDP